MTDGPHKSLPMPRPWKVVMERATKPAFSIHDLREARRAAVMSEFAGPIANEIRSVFRQGPQSSLLVTEVELMLKLEGMRSRHPGSAAITAVIDGLVACSSEGPLTQDSASRAVAYAVEDRLVSADRQMEEHCLRRAGENSIVEMRQRLTCTRNSEIAQEFAIEILQTPQADQRRGSIPLQRGLDQGVSLQ